MKKILKNFVITWINEWKQIGGKYNWYSFTLINIYFENEDYTGGFEFMFMFLGLGLIVRYNYNFENSYVGRIIKDSNYHNE